MSSPTKKKCLLCFLTLFTICIRLYAQASPPLVEVSQQEIELFLTPGGKYTQSDIEANGALTPSQKFKDFISSHNPYSTTGDFLCPISSTQANSKFSWIIGGNTYQFCSPVCIHEFLSLAKTSPHKIKDPQHYTKRNK